MAFKPSIAPAASTPAPAPSGIEGALMPDPVREAEIEQRGPDAERVARASAHVVALRTMNAVRTIGPIMAAAIASTPDPRQQAATFSNLLVQSTDLASKTLQEMGYDPTAERNRWMVNVLERGFADVVAVGAELDPSLPAQLAKAMSERGCEAVSFEDLSQDAALSTALVQGLLPVIAAQQQFDYFRNKEADLMEMRQLLLDEVAKTIDALLPGLTGASERRTMLGVLCQEGGKALAEAWLREADRAKEALSRLSNAEIKAWRTANPQGFPIKTVVARFREVMHRIRLLAKMPKTR